LIKVIQIIDDKTIGGINTVVRHLDNIFGNGSSIILKTISYSNTADDTTNYRNLLNHHFLNSRSFFKFIFKLRKCSTRNDILILHGFTPLIAFGILGTTYKTIFINHGVLGTGRKLKRYEIIKNFLLYFFINFFADTIVNVSAFSMNKFIDTYSVDPDRCKVIYNSTDFRQKELVFRKSDNIVLGYHGRFVHFKRVDRLIKVSHRLNRYYKSSVHIVGSGPLRDYYFELCRNLGVDLTVHDYTDTVQEEIAKFDFEIIPSNEENFGISVLEAILSGKITFVFSDGGGCTEIFGSNFNWYVCKSIDEAAEKILSLYNNFKDEDEKQFCSLQEYILERYSMKVMKDEYSKIIRSLI